jgi:hypothetical protein
MSKRKGKWLPCENCGKKCYKQLSEIARTKHHFCSQRCCNTWRTGRPRPEHGEKVRRALRGRKPSPQCIEAVRTAGKKRLSDPEIQAKMQTGLREYYRKNPGPNKGRFGKLNYNWRGGIAYEPYGAKFNEVLKEQIRERDNLTCQLCGMQQSEHIKEYGRRLAVHHIDYDKHNNHLSNLITLCYTCNGIANGNRSHYTALFNEHIARITQHESD